MTKTEQEVERIVLPIVEELGYSLYDVEFVKEGSSWFLRLYIDKETGIGLDDCELVSNAVSDKLDEEDPITTQYNLEVSSCGLERNLREKKHFDMAIGKTIEIRLYKPFEKQKDFQGVLENIDNDVITIETEDKRIDVKLDEISSAKILFDWEESENE